MSERHFDTSLKELKEKLLSMAGYVEKAIENATQALLESNTLKLSPVYEIEKKVNQAHINVDDGCVKLLALQQPLAVDLRLIVAILKINTDLERMGDQAVNIAHNTERYLKGALLKVLSGFPQISTEVRFMVRTCLDAFVSSSESAAKDVLIRDDKVDDLKNKIFHDILEHLKKNPQDIEQGLNLILIARNLERIGDHATNIAEDVIYVLTGQDIRHTPHTK